MQMTFYTGDAFPEQYHGDAFIAMRGSWNRKPPSGYEVLRIRFEDGQPAGFEPFVSGFLMEDATSSSGWGHMGRLAGLAEGPDGALYLSDDTNGVIYRIVYRGADEGSAAPELTNAAGANVRMLGDAITPGETPERGLARSSVEPSGAPIALRSTAFDDGEPIPKPYAAERQNISPPLEWEAGPEGTRSYALIVDDPDAPVPNPPFTHWVAYDIPADVTALREGVPGTPRLPEPEGMLQGPNDRGSSGWYGMRPPIGDPAHAYHFQLFALDRVLDLPHGASRAEVIDAMRGHVLAVGELVGTYRRPPG